MSESTTHRVVMAWDLHKRTRHDLLFEAARGYMHAAIVIFEEQQRAKDATFYNLLPGHFCLARSVELFLKAAISLAVNPIPTGQTNHNLEHLHSQYGKLFLGEKFAFRRRIDKLINSGRRFGKYGQDARYPFDQKGKVWRPNDHTSLAAS